MAKLSKKQLLSLSEEDRKKYFAQQLAELRNEEKIVKKELDRKANAEKAKNRSKINHAKYVVSGEFLSSQNAKPFLENLAKTKKYEARTALGLNLLMAELGFNITFVAISESK